MPPPPPPFLSVVIPTWREEGNVGAAVRSAWAAGADEVIVADGGSDDGTVGEAEAAGAIAVRTEEGGRGRGPQQNAGAIVARGEVLLFLHADSRLPTTAAARIRRTLVSPGVVGGRFDVRLDRGGLLLRTVEGMLNWRSRHTGVHTGDQAIFVRRDVFEALGGFPDQPLMEDIELSKRLRRRGRPACIAQRVVTSGRRWERHGVWRTVAKMWRLRFLYWLGVSSQRLAQDYG